MIGAASGVSFMDAELVWAAAGTLATCAGLAIAWWQLRLQARDSDRERRRTGSLVFGMSVSPPVGRLPAAVHGRGELLRELRGHVRRPPGAVVVLVGMGGIGKSTVAAELARQVARRHRRAWWISAADASSLTAGLITVAREVGATAVDLDALALGAADAPDRFWALLSHAPRGWVLIFDNADDPQVLVAGGGTGWIRPSRRGLIIVTSRHAERRTWGRHARLYAIDMLAPGDAARALHDLAPGAGDDAQAEALARRLAGLPLLLHLVGAYLDSDIVRWPTFTAYRDALDSGEMGALVGGSEVDPWTVLMRAWDVSLDDLARRGLPQARALLRLLACYAPTVPLPLDVLDPGSLASMLGTASEAARWAEVEQALNGLSRLGLIEARSLDGQGRGVVVHPVVAEANRACLERDPGTIPAVTVTEPEACVVRHAAVNLLETALAGLRWDKPEDWPRFWLLGLHLHALLSSVAGHLDREHLARLMLSLATTARALDQSGAVGAGENLCNAAEPHLSALGSDHPVSLRIQHQRAWEIGFMGFHTRAEERLQEVWQARRRVLGDDHHDTLATRHELGWIAAAQRRWEEAEQIYREVLQARRGLLGDEDPATLFSAHELGWAIANQGRLDEAEPMLHHVHEARGRFLGEGHPHTLDTRHELGWVAAKRDEWASAEAIFHEVWEARRAVLGDDHHKTLTTHYELGWVKARRGLRDEAERIYREVLRARQCLLGEGHPDTQATARALDQLRQGRIADADHLV